VTLSNDQQYSFR